MSLPNWFLALPLPPEAAWQMAAATAPVGLRRFDAHDLHLTLAFLGSCGEQAALAAWQAVDGLACPPLQITAAGWRALGPPRQPSAYGLTLALGHEALVALFADWGARALRAAGLPQARRPPLPHVTLLRPRRREAPQWRQPMQAWLESAPVPPQAAWLTELALWTWSEDRSQRLFQPLIRRPLG